KSSRPVGHRTWMGAAIAALLLALAYPVGANLFLVLGGVQKMFDDTDTIKVDFRRAWSFWPGRVHVDEIRVTMQDRNVQFVLTCAPRAASARKPRGSRRRAT